MEASFDQLPYSVHQIHDKLDKIEQLLLSRSNDPQPEEDKLLTIQQAAQLLVLSVRIRPTNPIFPIRYS